jgi:hypothetical protein
MRRIGGVVAILLILGLAAAHFRTEEHRRFIFGGGGFQFKF